MKKSLSPLSLSLSLVLCLSDYHSLSLSLSVFDFFLPNLHRRFNKSHSCAVAQAGRLEWKRANRTAH